MDREQHPPSPSPGRSTGGADAGEHVLSEGVGVATQGWADLVLDRLVQDEVADLDRPHLVVCRHLETGITSYQGPYLDAMTAATAADQEQVAAAPTEGEAVMSFTVAPLFDTGQPPHATVTDA